MAGLPRDYAECVGHTGQFTIDLVLTAPRILRDAAELRRNLHAMLRQRGLAVLQLRVSIVCAMAQTAEAT